MLQFARKFCGVGWQYEIFDAVIGSPMSETTRFVLDSKPIYKNRLVTYLLHLSLVLAISAAAVLTGEFLINRIYFHESIIFDGEWLALAGNFFILSCFMTLLLALVNRRLLAIILGLLFYGFLITVDIIKLTYLEDPLRPSDFQYLEDLRVIARSSINGWTLLEISIGGAIATGLCVFLWRKARPAMSRTRRIGTGLIAASLLIGCFALPSEYAVQDWAVAHGIVNPMGWHFEPRASARSNGLLVEWAMGAANPGILRPERYSRSEIERIANNQKQEQAPAPGANDKQPINLIIYLVEAFMDPQDLGVRFTSDPIPTFHALGRNYSSGKVVVPVFGGTSANTEFELLTGLPMYFLPEWSCPYRQYIARDIPSLPRALHANGYRTVAIPADPAYLFNHRAVFEHLGFDEKLFLAADAATPRSPNPAFVSDDAIADATIKASCGSSPYFIFSFTAGSHFPWDYADYRKSRLDLVDPMPEPDRSTLKTYVNALSVADKSLKKLINHFRQVDQRTAILILGDHLPALAEVYDRIGFFNVPVPARIQRRYETPAVLWCNWPATKEDFRCSINFMAARLLQFMGIPRSGNFTLNAEIHARFPVLSRYVQTSDGRRFLPQAPDLPFQSLLEDYRLIEYDLLKGGQYALAFPGWQLQRPGSLANHAH
jgi:phosphoglycerol transferase MdoB-like AlkP superfamily enzyme